MLDVVTVRPVAFLPEPFLAPPWVGFMAYRLPVGKAFGVVMTPFQLCESIFRILSICSQIILLMLLLFYSKQGSAIFSL